MTNDKLTTIAGLPSSGGVMGELKAEVVGSAWASTMKSFTSSTPVEPFGKVRHSSMAKSHYASFGCTLKDQEDQDAQVRVTKGAARYDESVPIKVQTADLSGDFTMEVECGEMKIYTTYLQKKLAEELWPSAQCKRDRHAMMYGQAQAQAYLQEPCRADGSHTHSLADSAVCHQNLLAPPTPLKVGDYATVKAAPYHFYPTGTLVKVERLETHPNYFGYVVSNQTLEYDVVKGCMPDGKHLPLEQRIKHLDLTLVARAIYDEPVDPYAAVKAAYAAGRQIEVNFGGEGWAPWQKYHGTPSWSSPPECYRVKPS